MFIYDKIAFYCPASSSFMLAESGRVLNPLPTTTARTKCDPLVDGRMMGRGGGRGWPTEWQVLKTTERGEA